MVFLMNALKAFHGNVRIDLGRGDIGVTQHDLDDAQVGPAFQQMAGK